MKKVAVIYWSNAGNVEVLANKIYEGAKNSGGEVEIKLVNEAKIEDVINADAVALGSPSMDNNRIEQQEMEPFVHQLKTLPTHSKPLVLFGSYGWDDGQFMRDWKERMIDYGFNVLGDLVVKEAPNTEELTEAFELGKLLVEYK